MNYEINFNYLLLQSNIYYNNQESNNNNLCNKIITNEDLYYDSTTDWLI